MRKMNAGKRKNESCEGKVNITFRNGKRRKEREKEDNSGAAHVSLGFL